MNIQEKINKCFKKSPEACYFLIKELNYDFNLVPKEILDVFYGIKNNKFLFKISKDLNFDLGKIPLNLLENLSSKESWLFWEFSNVKLNKIPKEIIDNIAKNSYFSFILAEELNFDLNKIPKEIIKGIAKDAGNSHELARKLEFDLNKIPIEIFIGISKDKDYSLALIQDLDKRKTLKDIPQDILDRIGKSISKNLEYSLRFKGILISNCMENRIPAVILNTIKEHFKYK